MIFTNPAKNHKTLYLFHGAFTDSNCWLQYTNIESYVEQHGLAVVLPSVAIAFMPTCCMALPTGCL
jgi:hypothetical protein